MKTRRLGRTGLVVAEIGFGTWGLGGTAGGAVAYGPTDDEESRRALRTAMELGVNFFDTSDLYGAGHSERLLGEVCAGRRDEVVLATKAGFLGGDGRQDFSPAHLQRALEGSLVRLRTDRVELLQLHNPPPEFWAAPDVTVGALEGLRTAGKIRAWGVSVRSPEDGLAAAGPLGAAVIQVNFNLADQRARKNGLLQLCAERGVGCIIRTPLCFGFLAAPETARMDFPAGDHRARWPQAQRERWAEAGVRFLGAAGGGERQTAAQLALRFCLSYPAVSTVIPGMLDEGQVRENSAASRLGPLTAEERRTLEALYEELPAFDATARPDQSKVDREPGA